MKLHLKKQRLLFLLLVLSFLGLFLRLLFLYKHSTAFTYDQARDLLDLREMWLLKKPRLIGANTSLHGVFYGPFWYWLCFPFYFLTGGHPSSTLIPILVISFFMPIIFFLIVSNKRLGFLLSGLYIFSHSFFAHSIVALNTNPMIFFTALFLILLTKLYQEEKKVFLPLTMFLAGVSFHFEPIIGILWIPIFLASSALFKKTKLVLENKKAAFFFLIPFAPQVIFEFRHGFLQTKALWTAVTGDGSSLTPAEGGLVFRFFDRVRVFKDVFIFQNGGSLVLASFSLILVSLLVFKILRLRKPKKEEDYLGLTCLISLILVFIGFVFYPYALWPWYLGAVDAIMLTLIGLGIYSLSTLNRKSFLFSSAILVVFLSLNISQYFPWPLEQGFSPDPANFRTRVKVVDLVYGNSNGRGFKVFTFAPYVYDYPYQYLIWWRAKTKYHFLPEEYFYLPNQPQYVAAKDEADRMIPSKKSECDYLIIEPFESQEKWFWDWRGRFPDAQKTWHVGETRIEKLCRN